MSLAVNAFAPPTPPGGVECLFARDVGGEGCLRGAGVEIALRVSRRADAGLLNAKTRSESAPGTGPGRHALALHGRGRFGWRKRHRPAGTRYWMRY